MKKLRILPLGCSVLLLATLLPSSGCRSTYYAAYEKFGVYKRDILKKRVTAARDEQKAAGEQFKDALTRLKEITQFEGGELEKQYNALKSEFDDCTSRAQAVGKRIKDMHTVATDLFAEWEKEIGQIGTPSLREGSERQLRETRERYQTVETALQKAEQSMTPVLNQFRDYVLFLKHNLNAQAVASLKGEAANIQGEISRLITQMNTSIARADEFIKTLQ